MLFLFISSIIVYYNSGGRMRHNYLNNKDILKEIHKSKTSYCSYKKPEDSEYDLILKSISQINPTNIRKAKKARAEKLTKQNTEAGKPAKVTTRSISNQDIVFRVMTFDHIPPKTVEIESEDAEEQEVVENEPVKYVKVNFPPFQHYRLTKKGNPTCVGKSHWKGDLKTGEFCKDHGALTNKLATMFMKLCERYATRSNWRGYCVDSSTECLTQRGWLSESELTTDDTIMSFNGLEMIWSPIHSIFRDNYNGKMFKMTSRSLDALITPGHKIVTDRGLVKIEYLLESDQIVVMGEPVKHDDEKIFSNNFVELMGWITTEGNYQPKKKVVTIYQNEGKYADRIRTCLLSLGYSYTERKSTKSSNIAFAIKREHWDDIVSVMPNKNLTMPFILSLTEDQRELLIDTMINGDGHRNEMLMRYTQKDKKHIDMFQALCALHGLKSNTHFVENKMSFGKPTSYYTMNIFSRRGNKTRGACVDLYGGKNNGKKHIGKGKQFHPNFPTVDYSGIVWCPETDYGCFLARRNGKVYLTGNTYNDEMRSQALLQLIQIGLQFNELKSANPFAYYTAVISNTFTRVLNIEKRNQNIRDDILEMNNLTPSYTRQNQNSPSYEDH